MRVVGGHVMRMATTLGSMTVKRIYLVCGSLCRLVVPPPQVYIVPSSTQVALIQIN